MASHNFFYFFFTLAFFGELWHNLQRGNPASTQIILILGLIAWFGIRQPWHIVLFVSMSYFPSIASSMVKDWPIWWGGGNLSITIVDHSFDRTSHWSHFTFSHHLWFGCFGHEDPSRAQARRANRSLIFSLHAIFLVLHENMVMVTVVGINHKW